MTSTPAAKLLSQEDALLNLRNAFYELQHHQIALDELWEVTNEGVCLPNPAYFDRQLKEIADQADRVRATLDLVQSIRRYRHLVNEPQLLTQ